MPKVSFERTFADIADQYDQGSKRVPVKERIARVTDWVPTKEILKIMGVSGTKDFYRYVNQGLLEKRTVVATLSTVRGQWKCRVCEWRARPQV